MRRPLKRTQIRYSLFHFFKHFILMILNDLSFSYSSYIWHHQQQNVIYNMVENINIQYGQYSILKMYVTSIVRL